MVGVFLFWGCLFLYCCYSCYNILVMVLPDYCLICLFCYSVLDFECLCQGFEGLKYVKVSVFLFLNGV